MTTIHFQRPSTQPVLSEPAGRVEGLRMTKRLCVTLVFVFALSMTPVDFALGNHCSSDSAPIMLLEPLPDGSPGGKTHICVSENPFGALNEYLKPLIPFVVGIAAGIAVLMIIIGGIQIIFSGGEPGKITEGRQRITAAIIGLLILVFSAAILHVLNASYYLLSSGS